MAPVDDELRRFASDEGGLEWRDWGGDFVVYVASTACTHLITPLAGAVLMQLIGTRRPLTHREVADRLFGAGAHAEEVASVRATLLELERVGAARAEC